MKAALAACIVATASLGCSHDDCAVVVRDEATATGDLHFAATAYDGERSETFDVPMTTPLAGAGTGRYAAHAFRFTFGHPPPITVDVTFAVLPETGATHVDDQSARICAGANACQSLYGAPIVIVDTEDCGTRGCAETIDLEIRVSTGEHFTGNVHVSQREHLETKSCDD